VDNSDQVLGEDVNKKLGITETPLVVDPNAHQ
jgi:hypothetical protein